MKQFHHFSCHRIFLYSLMEDFSISEFQLRYKINIYWLLTFHLFRSFRKRAELLLRYSQNNGKEKIMTCRIIIRFNHFPRVAFTVFKNLRCLKGPHWITRYFHSWWSILQMLKKNMPQGVFFK